MIANKYDLLTKISEGSFGVVFKAQNRRTKEMVAIKFENKSELTKSLKHEAKIYQYLGKMEGFLQLKMFGSFADKNYLVLELLGESLYDVIDFYKTLELKTVLVLGIQIIQRINSIHDKLLLHRDIKTSNFVFDKHTNKLYLIDFGFVKRYEYNGVHIEEKNINNIIGSVNFVSLNVHNKIEPSRRDDIESCVYVILTMFLGRLSWFNNNNLNEIIKLKENVMKDKRVPLFIKTMLSYVRNLEFNERPNYEYLIDLMDIEFKTNNFINDNKFEWC